MFIFCPSGLLLEEFFLFFSTEFDYSSFVVSVRTGCMTTITSVLDELNGTTHLETGLAVSSSSCDKNGNLCFEGESTNMADCFPGKLSTSLLDNSEKQKALLGSSSSNPNSSPRYGKRVQFKVSPLIVQDPFELVHNLTQNVPASVLKHTVELMKEAHKICQNLDSCLDSVKNNSTTLLDLLTVCKSAKKRKHTNCHSFFVGFQEVMDSSCTVKLTTTRAVFQFVVENLEREFGMKCERKSLAKRKRIEEGNSDLLSQATQLAEEPQEPHPLKETQIAEQVEEDIDEVGDSFSAICTAFENTWTHCRRERRKSLHTHKQSNNEISEKDVQTGSSKEQWAETTCDPEQVRKSASSTESSPKQSVGLASVNSISSPILVFELKVNSSSQTDSKHGCVVSMEHVESLEFQLFGNFFTAYKKHLHKANKIN